MTSPDVTPYVDLTLFDRDPQTLYEDAQAALEALIPDFVARESATEVLLMEAIAEQVSYLIFAANRLPGAVTSVVLQLLGLTPLTSVPAGASFEFTASIDTGTTIPEGTQLQMELSGVTTITFETDEDLVIPNGQTTGSVTATATVDGTDPHALNPGDPVNVVDALIYVEGAALESSPSGGRDAETDSDFLDRGTERLLRLSEALVLPQHFERYMLEQDDVFRAKALDLYDPGTGPSPGSNPGHTTVAIAKTGGGLFTTGEKSQFESDMEDRSHAGLDVHVVDPDLFAIDVTVTVVKEPAAEDPTVQQAVDDALTDYFDPDQWDWETTVYLNELISLIDGVTDVRRVSSITMGVDGGGQSAADATLSSEYPLTTAGTFSITVNTP